MTFRRLLGFAWPFRRALALSLGLMLLETAAALTVPWLGGLFASGVLSAGTFSIGTISLGLLGLLGLRFLLQGMREVVLASTAQGIRAKLRTDLYDHVQALPLSFFHARRQGDLLALLTYEVERLGAFITGTLLNILPMALTLVGALVLMMRINPLLALPVMFCIPVFFLAMKIIGRKLRPLAVDLREAYAGSVAIAEENLSMLPAIKSFTREDEESERHASQVDLVRRLGVRMARIEAFLGPAMQFLAAGAVVLLLWVAGDQVLGGDMAPGNLVAFLLYAALLTRPVSGLANIWGQTQLARGTLARLGDVFGEEAEPFTGGIDPGVVRGAIAFEGIAFSYAGRSAALQDVSLDIQAGETIALTGENGAGKTTLVDLLLRFHIPDRGRITLDSVDIQTLSLSGLRSQIGVVPQQVLLFNGTVRANIRYGKPDASDDAIERAARIAQAESFIADLPEGYETVVGDKGVRLSGGQRQRIALARAILKDPAVLILDEPTAMFDPVGEQGFVEQAREAFAGRTVILITHRPASLALADRIITLDAGRIIEPRERTGEGQNVRATEISPTRQERSLGNNAPEQESET